MIVKCIKLYNDITKKYNDSQADGFLTIGNHYNVIEIYFKKDIIYYRVNPDGENYYRHPILVRSEDFEVVSGKIPLNWHFNKNSVANSALFGPKDWIHNETWEETFWQDLDNNLPRAKYVFDRDFKIIIDCDLEYIEIIKKERNMI